MSRTARLAGASIIPALAAPFVVVSSATAADIPAPPTNPNLPPELDVASPYLPQTVCDPDAKPGVTAFARLMANHYNRFSYGISRACNYGLTEHSEGRALDWMLNSYDPTDRAIAESVLAWLMAPDGQGRPGANARRFGVMYVIWNRQIWGTYDMAKGWRPYYGPNPHTDHIHLSFSWDGAMQRTSWWTGVAWTGVTTTPGGTAGTPSTPTPTPTPTSYPTLRQGDSGPDVALAQKVLGVPADGQFGPMTYAALRTWQAAKGVPVTGVLDTATWGKMVALGLVPARGTGTGTPSGDLSKWFSTTLRLGSSGEAVKALQTKLGITADGAFGSNTERAVKAFQEKSSLTVDGVVTTNVWRALAGLDYTKDGGTTPAPTPTPPVPAIKTTTEYTAVKSLVLATGSRGEAVKVLQRALGGVAVDGSFGSVTDKAVRAFQASTKLPATGVVDGATWDALERRDYPFLKYRTTVLREGSTGYPVTVLQRYLGVTADGSYGTSTSDAVRALQGRQGLARTGYVGGLTWQALEREIRARRG